MKSVNGARAGIHQAGNGGIVCGSQPSLHVSITCEASAILSSLV